MHSILLSDFHFFSLFFRFLNRNLSQIYFPHTEAWSTVVEDVTNYVTHRIFNTDWQYSCASFTLKVNENLASLTGFQYDLMIIRKLGLLFWAILHICACYEWCAINMRMLGAIIMLIVGRINGISMRKLDDATCSSTEVVAATWIASRRLNTVFTPARNVS